MGDWFETAMKVVVLLASVGVLSAVFGLARRLAGDRHSSAQQWLRALNQRRDPAADAELAELRQTVERLNGDVLELQERVDFTERMLAQQRERQALPER